LKGSIQISKLLGSRAVETADSLRAPTTTNPTDIVFCSLGAESISASAGVFFCYDFKLIMHVRFYGREVDLSLAALASRLERHLAARAQYQLRKQLALSEKKPSEKN